jgi:hypothetical protein
VNWKVIIAVAVVVLLAVAGVVAVGERRRRELRLYPTPRAALWRHGLPLVGRRHQ